MSVMCSFRGHVWQEQPWPRELGRHDQTVQFIAHVFGAECYEVCTRCHHTRWRSYTSNPADGTGEGR